MYEELYKARKKYKIQNIRPSIYFHVQKKNENQIPEILLRKIKPMNAYRYLKLEVTI